jgi:hypothetical protein
MGILPLEMGMYVFEMGILPLEMGIHDIKWAYIQKNRYTLLEILLVI